MDKPAVYLNDWVKPNWKNQTNLDLLADAFKLSPSDLKGVKILLASYACESYEGSAFVLFQKGKDLYEVHGSHCSCNGLEDQWKPEKTSIKELRFRLEQGHLGRESYSGNVFAAELTALLDRLEAAAQNRKAAA